ncbi:MAG TPA: hypothetical protein VKC51_02900, partial [Lacunisphaera sp.]|nr:hypothetical protein [Lacunisphaera sp.]
MNRPSAPIACQCSRPLRLRLAALWLAIKAGGFRFARKSTDYPDRVTRWLALRLVVLLCGLAVAAPAQDATAPTKNEAAPTQDSAAPAKDTAAPTKEEAVPAKDESA